MMSVAVLVAIALAGIWCVVVGDFSLRQLLLGLLFGGLFVLATGTGRGRKVPLRELPRRVGYLSWYLLVLLPHSVVQSNLRIARRLLRVTPEISPGIIRLPLGDLPRAAEALEEHGVTLSPGQMVVDYTEDEQLVYVHVIDVAEAEAELPPLRQRYETVLTEVFR